MGKKKESRKAKLSKETVEMVSEWTDLHEKIDSLLETVRRNEIKGGNETLVESAKNDIYFLDERVNALSYRITSAVARQCGWKAAKTKKIAKEECL